MPFPDGDSPRIENQNLARFGAADSQTKLVGWGLRQPFRSMKCGRYS